MKSITLLCLLATLSAGAASSVADVKIRQDWPWSQKVYINYTLETDSACDLEVSATWRGRESPLVLSRWNGLSGVTTNLTSGTGTLTWDPHMAGLTNALPGLKIAVAPPSLASERTYLVFDLHTGTHEYLSDVPTGGWTAEHKTSKLVFRRIPAGTFQCGASSEVRKYVGCIDDREQEHTVTLSHDYYFAVFPLTQAQYGVINGSTVSESSKLQPQRTTYDVLRGTFSGGFNWPKTGYRVLDASPIAKLRKKLGGAFLIDLATDAQWERAARAGSNGIWYAIDGYPLGGMPSELGAWGSEACTKFLNTIAKWKGSSNVAADVGQCTPNAWGIYDVIGLNFEWVLDSNYTTADATDPVGNPVSADGALRVRRGGCSATVNRELTVFGRNQWVSTGSGSGGGYLVRLVIHLGK